MRTSVQLYAAEVVENNLQCGDSPGDFVDIVQRVAADQEIDRTAHTGSQSQIANQRVGQLIQITAGKTIADIAFVFAQLCEKRSECIGTDCFRHIANDAAVEPGVMGGDIEIPLIVDKCLS